MKNKEELITFENWTIETFNAGKLRSPVHLSGGNEEQLIEIFKDIKPQDWVFTTYRSHYHALLKGVPEQRLKDWILDNKSIHFMDKEYKVFSSAIVGGTLPIALGVAMEIKRRRDIKIHHCLNCQKSHDIDMDTPAYGCDCGAINEFINYGKNAHVYVFIGDMTASLGVFNDCLTYAVNHKLPITFVIECNYLSTDTDTAEVWGIKRINLEEHFNKIQKEYSKYVKVYFYERKFPHYGTGVFVKSLWKDIIDKNDPRKQGF